MQLAAGARLTLAPRRYGPLVVLRSPSINRTIRPASRITGRTGVGAHGGTSGRNENQGRDGNACELGHEGFLPIPGLRGNAKFAGNHGGEFRPGSHPNMQKDQQTAQAGRFFATASEVHINTSSQHRKRLPVATAARLGSGDDALRSNGDGVAIAVALNSRTLPNWNRMPNWARALSAGKPMNCRWPLHPSWEAALASAI